jgi:hypothetical protein
MAKYPDFIGIGAQRAGTSWIYACLYEHPDLYNPIKEVHFFSRQRNWSRGYPWYESLFEQCPPSAKAGEFSTSYLEDLLTPERIQRRYPEVKLIVSLRNPVKRAYSNYMNDIMAGLVKPDIPFSKALVEHPEYLERGRYASHLQRYLQTFSRDHLLVLIYEDSFKDPHRFIQTIYSFIGVSSSFVPSMINTKINESRVPKWIWVDRLLIKTSQFLRIRKLHRLWWFAKSAGLGHKVRAINSRRIVQPFQTPSLSDRKSLYEALEDDIESLEVLLGRELREWHLCE